LEPDSISLVVVLVLAAAALLFALAKYRNLAVRAVSGLLALILAGLAGVAVVNDYFGYYQSWSQLSADLSGSYSAFAVTDPHAGGGGPGGGRLMTVRLAGKRSHFDRSALVYLPPQYFEKQYAHTRFPVVELIHGTPGGPWTWVVHVEIVAVMDRLIHERRIGPMVLVMPRTFVGHHPQECVNAPGALDDTYITQEVRADIEAKFRVSRVPADWGIAGFSSGGYCAANLALRHPAMFGASAVMDGYFRPQDGEAARALHFDPAAEAANDPLRLAAALKRSAGPLPAFWVSAGTQTSVDSSGARAFVAALRGVEQVPLYLDHSAGHSFYEWNASIPHVLAWMWAQLAPPQLRVRFPLLGPVGNTVLVPNLVTVPSPQQSTLPGQPRPRSVLVHGHAAVLGGTPSGRRAVKP
jgi:poly(3-hydroxybutyrate) depolymerase